MVKKRLLSAFLAVMLAGVSVSASETTDCIGMEGMDNCYHSDIQPVRVKSVNEFRQYISDDGVCAGYDMFDSGEAGEEGSLYIFEVPEAGRLLVCNLCQEQGAVEYTFSDESGVIGKPLQTYTGADKHVEVINVTKGTYYFVGKTTRAVDSEVECSTFLGLIPSINPSGVSDFKVSESEVDAVDVTAVPLSQPEDMEDVIYSTEPVITEAVEYESDVAYRVALDEDFWLFVGGNSEMSTGYVSVYSNNTLTDKRGSNTVLSGDRLVAVDSTASGNGLKGYYLRKGDYYLRLSSDEVSKCSVWLGAYKASDRISVDSINYSDDKSYATVTLKYDERFCDKLRMNSGDTSVEVYYCDTAWRTANEDNVVTNKVKVTEDGTYTVRSEGSADDYNCYARFTISGLKLGDTEPGSQEEKPVVKKPKITKAKVGTKVIKGTAQYEYKAVAVIVNKTKPYFSIKINKKGVWKVNLRKKLKKGDKITVAYSYIPKELNKTLVYTVKKGVANKASKGALKQAGKIKKIKITKAVAGTRVIKGTADYRQKYVILNLKGYDTWRAAEISKKGVWKVKGYSKLKKGMVLRVKYLNLSGVQNKTVEYKVK